MGCNIDKRGKKMYIIEIDDDVLVYDNGDGTSKEKALIIFDAIDEKDGVEFEYKILEKLYPGFTTLEQSHIFEGDRVFDLIKISANGHKREVWFDISGFYGKA